MKRLAADDGGVWKGTVEGGRIILYLGAPQPDTVEDSYVAVLWDAREPKVRIFEFMRFLVDQAGNISITLFPVEGHKPRSEPVLVFGKYVNGSIRLEEIHESSNSFPAVATLERSAIDNEVDELRKRFKRGLDKDY